MSILQFPSVASSVAPIASLGLARIANQGIASGLQQHSVGSLFPVIVVGRGINPISWEVHLGRSFCPKLTHESAQELAENIAKIHHEQGWDAAIRALTAANIRININA